MLLLFISASCNLGLLAVAIMPESDWKTCFVCGSPALGALQFDEVASGVGLSFGALLGVWRGWYPAGVINHYFEVLWRCVW